MRLSVTARRNRSISSELQIVDNVFKLSGYGEDDL